MRANFEKILLKNKIEFRRGNAGGGNQLRQPYLKQFVKNINLINFKEHTFQCSRFPLRFENIPKYRECYFVTIPLRNTFVKAIVYQRKPLQNNSTFSTFVTHVKTYKGSEEKKT